MAEIGTGETEISPIKSLQKGIKRLQGAIAHPRRVIAVTGMTAETKLPAEGGGLQKDVNGEPLNPERTLDERFERGEMYRIIKRILKERSTAATVEEKEAWNQRFHAAVEISRDLKSKLDILNRQYYSPEYMQLVGVEVLGEHAEIPVRHYSLRDIEKTPEGEVLPPIVIIGGATSGPTVTKSAAEAFALQYPDRDVYVIGYPESNQSKISADLPKKLKEHGNLATYTKINRDVIFKMGFENFDLVGLSMGGGIVLQAAADAEFAKRINNLIAISPTNIQGTKGKRKMEFDFAREVSYLRMHPKQWLRVPQVQPGYKLGSHDGMGLATSGEIARRKELSVNDLVRLHVQGRVIIGTGDKDAVISCGQIEKETKLANERRMTNGEKPIEFMEVLGGHHSLGDAYAAGIVALFRHTDILPKQILISQLENSTAKVLVRENPIIAPIADQILK